MSWLQDHKWKWTNGEVLSHSELWARGQPADQANKKCVRMKNNGKWETANCDETNGYTCMVNSGLNRSFRVLLLENYYVAKLPSHQ